MTFFRYQESNTSAGINVYEYKYSLVKETPKGYWITFYTDAPYGYEKLREWKRLHWISKTSKKKFAYESRERAWNNYQLRKLRQIKILEARLANAKAAYRCQQPKINEKSVDDFNVSDTL